MLFVQLDIHVGIRFFIGERDEFTNRKIISTPGHDLIGAIER